MMDLQLFFDSFEVIAAAPNGVKKLRELILQLAVRGKLVAQDPADEPAGKLLERILKEKEQLVKEKSIKARTTSPIEESEIPYAVPSSWQWVQLSAVGHDLGQKKPDQEFTYIDVSAIDKERGIVSDDVTILEASEAPSRARKIVQKETLIYSTVRPNLLNIAIIDKEFYPEAIVSTAFAVIHPFSGILNKYLYFYLRTQIFIDYVAAQMKGMAYPAINDGQLFQGLVPLPPSNEQKRIVAKVDELMKLCDTLETQQQQNRSHLTQMQKSAIAQLLSAPDADAFAQYWQDIVENFELLFDDGGAIGDLRQAIFQLAVQGKLVRQDSADKSAAVLLEKIKAERQELLATGKLAKLKKTQKIEAGIDGTAAIPGLWIWTRLGELIVFGPKNGHSPKPVDYPTPVKSLTLSATTSGRFNGSCYKYIDDEIPQNSHLWLEVNDILIQRGNSLEYVGISAIYTEQFERFIYPDLMMKIRMSKYTCPSYLHLVINGENSRNFFKERASGTSGSMPKVNQEIVINLPIPLPPLAEQKRIVAKVNQLMTLCDTLQTHLTQRQASAIDLAEVAVRQVLDRH
jgi:type I restriction enzyme, S subunit